MVEPDLDNISGKAEYVLLSLFSAKIRGYSTTNYGASIEYVTSRDPASLEAVT
jgi:hypothetical protein